MTAIICGISSTQLTQDEINVIKHPLVCGIILFKRNFENYSQLKTLVQTIKSTFGNDFIISVDQEGGRVRRFDLPFTRLPPLSDLSTAYRIEKDLGKASNNLYALQLYKCGFSK